MKEKIIELRKNGFTINQIVKKLNCAKGTVSYHINNAGLGGRVDNFLSNVDEKTINEIIKLRMSQKTYPEISNQINISEDRLKRICRNNKINNAANTIKKSINNTDVLNYYLNIKSLRKTAKYFETTKGHIRKLVGDNNIIYKREKTISKSQSVINWRKRTKIELVKYKGGKCEKCGYDKCISALTFHHLDPTQKDFAISGKSYSIEKLKKEVDKCIMVCANCHIEIHDEIKENKLFG
jgi:DNA-binding CsgD family transcriptional regulator